MLQESLSGVKTVAKLALRCHTVLEALRESFEFLILGNEFIILNLLLSNGLAEHAVCVSHPVHALSIAHQRWLVPPLFIDSGH